MSTQLSNIQEIIVTGAHELVVVIPGAGALNPGDLSIVAISGSYTDLTNLPDLTVYALISSLEAVAFTGDYTDLLNIPAAVDLSLYALISSLGAVAFSGEYANLLNTPSLGSAAAAAVGDFATAAQGAKADTALQGVNKATAADIRAGTADKVITADGVEAASELVTLTDAVTIAVDWSAFINGSVTLGGNRTLGNPTNGEPGTTRTVLMIQDGTGSRLLTLDTQYKSPGGTAPVLTTTAGGVDMLQIYCRTATEFLVTSALGFA